MKYIKTILTSLLLILCMNASSVANEVDWMPDANLRAAVQTALGLGNGDTLTKEAMTNLTQLSAERSNIANITGLEHATNLTDLQLPFNQITDISPLRTLTHLTNLVLDNNPIGDITALGNLTDLKILQVKNCGITDVSPLLTLVNLTTLRIALNNLANISPLRTLTHLTNLVLDNNPIGDITALGNLTDLKILQVKNCGITDVSPLLTLVNLTTLRIAVNDLTNAHLLSTLTNLKDIDITIPDPPPADVDPPGVSLTIPSVVQNGAFSVTITFTEAVSGFTESDLSLSGTATASITAWRTTNNTTYIADNTIYTADSTTYTATITPTTGGTVILNVAPNVATDPANNPNTAAETKTVNVEVDRATVTIGVPSGTQTGAFDATITFSKTVSDFAQSDVSLTGAAASITAWNANNDNTVYTATITPTASGTVTINVAANVAKDAANNPNTAATAKTVSVDVDKPTVTIGVPSGTQTGAFNTTITFSETVSGFAQSDVALTGAAASITAWNANNNTVYTATITPTASGTVTINVPVNVAKDAANNPNTAATAKNVTVSLDTTAPSVSITVPTGTQNSAFDATITFTEAVSGFTQSDLSLSGTATVSITSWNANNDNTTYTATITPTTSGTVIFNIEAGVATDAANNNNTAATAKTVNVDIDKPTVTIGVPSGTQTGAFDATITFSETVSDFAQSDVSLTGAAASITTWSANNNKTVYTATITPTASGTVTINVAANVAKDAANNPNTAATAKTVTVSLDPPPPRDTDAPSISISAPSDVQNGAFSVTITFTEAVSGFTQSDLSLSGTATASITNWNANTENTTYTATITPTTSGTVILNVAANVAKDAANNPNTAATAKTVDVDVDKPTVTIGVPSGTQTGAFNTTITFSETVSGFAQSDVSLTGAAASITAWNANNDNTVYTATITPTANGTVTINVAADVATDAAGNNNTAATAKNVTVTILIRDTTAPSVSITAPSAVQNGAFSATITFTEVVSDFVQADLSLTGTATASITAWNTTDNITYTATITPTTSGTVILNVAANVAKDAANNPNTAATVKTVNVDIDKPTVTIGVPSGTQTGAFNTTITFSEAVSGFAQSDVALTGAAASITTWNANNNKTVYTATITPTASGTVTINVPVNVAKDAADNPNTAATGKTVTVSLDTTAPSVSITVPTGPQNSAFDATTTFTEAVSGFTQSALSLSGTATASITSWNANNDNTTYTATITPTTSGTVILNVAANVAKDAANNPNTAATAKTVNVDVDKPTVTIGVPSGTQTGAFNTTITFSEAVSGFAQSDVALTGSAASVTGWRSNNNNTVYTATITPTASGTVTVSVAASVAKDAANNPNTAATAKTVTVDVDALSVSIFVPSAAQNGAFDTTITFTEAVSGFEQADVGLSGTATATITAWSANAENTVYTATITPTASGTVTVSVAASVAKDAANNPNTAATAKTVNVDVDRPTVTIGVPSGTQIGAFDATITFSETVSDFAQSDGSLTGAAASITAWNANANNTIYTATITPTASGTVTINVAANVAKDAANNPNTAATAKTVTVEQSGNDPPEPSSNAVNIPDPNLRAAIETALGKARGATITETDMETLTKLGISRSSGSISDLTGLEYAINLTRLSLIMVGISDISPVAGLTNLTSLYLPTNRISNISPVAGLTNLTSLSLPNNDISDISPVAGLTNLTSVDLSQNKISNISALAGLTNLTSLFLSNNRSISSIRAVEGLTNLTDLRLGQNNISNISWLSRLTNLTSMSLSGNRISDISSIADLTNLQWLSLSTNHISDIASLSDLTDLTYLSLSDNKISDISPIAGLTNLQTLSLFGNGIIDISSVAGLTNLKNLSLGHNTTARKTTWEPPYESLTDISAISNLTNLRRLSLGRNSISDISPVAGLTNLTNLALHNNNITDISSLAQLTNLNDLWLAENSITDISALVANTGLGNGDRLLLSGNPLSAESINTHIPALENRGVDVSFYVAGAPKKALTGIPSVLGLSGKITDQTARQNQFRVTVKNLSNAEAALTINTDGEDYQLEVEAGETGDILEISAQSADSSIAVQPLRYTLTAEDVLRGRIQLPALVAYEIPTETKLLANYPNPFNPETWIPYRLAADAFVTLTIYDSSGQIVRTIDVGHQIAAVYESQSKAVHWDGRNASGEPVSSGVYFYHLSAGDYSATRRMLILK